MHGVSVREAEVSARARKDSAGEKAVTEDITSERRIGATSIIDEIGLNEV